MKKLFVFIFCLFMFFGVAFAEKTISETLVSELNFAESSCKKYEWAVKDNIIIVNSAVPFTIEKDKNIFNAETSAKNGTDIGKTLHIKLMKNSEIERVAMTYKQIAIVKVPYPHEWGKTIEEVLEIINSVLCK